MTIGARWITDWEPTERFPDYTRANAGEVLADPCSPLGWTFCWEGGIVPGCRDGFVSMGVFDADEYDLVRPEAFGSFGGYLYNSLTQARLFGVRSGAGWQAIDNAYFDDPSAVPPYQEQPWHVSELHSAKLAKTMGWFLSTDDAPVIDAHKRVAAALRDSRPDLSTQTVRQLIGRARTIQPHLIPLFADEALGSLGASVGPGVLAALTAEIDPTMVTKLLAGVGDIDSALIANAIWDISRIVRDSAELGALLDAAGAEGMADRLAAATGDDAERLRAAVDAFLYEHGCRGPNEWDLPSPAYETKPSLLWSAVDRLRHADESHSPREGAARNAAERQRLVAQLEAAFAGNDEALGMLHAGLKSAAVFMGARERSKTNCIRTLHEIRMCFEELAARLVASGQLADRMHLYMLLDRELDAFVADPASFAGTLAERYADWQHLAELEPPYAVVGTVPPISEWPRRGTATAAPVAVGDVLKGVAGSPGVVTGTAKVLLSVDDDTDLEPGDILVAPATDPSWTPLFLAAGAVVVNVGALGTHAVIVSRELGIPCVPSVSDATLRIPTGATITVNGHEGTVTIDALP